MDASAAPLERNPQIASGMNVQEQNMPSASAVHPLPAGVGSTESTQAAGGPQAQQQQPAEAISKDGKGNVVVTVSSSTKDHPAEPCKQEDSSMHGGPVKFSLTFPPFLSSKSLALAIAALLLIWGFCWFYISAAWDPLSRVENLKVGCTLPKVAQHVCSKACIHNSHQFSSSSPCRSNICVNNMCIVQLNHGPR